MDRLTAITAFVRSAEHGSFARAGASLGLHGSAVSKTVARLEAQLGARLFHRSTRALTLTDDGAVYLERCSRILLDLDDADAAVSHRAGMIAGRLKVSLPVALGRTYLVPKLTRTFTAHPGLRLVAELADRYVDLIGEGYDSAVRIGDLADTRLITRRVGAVRYVTCAAPSYLEAAGEPRTLADLGAHRCVVFARQPDAKPLPWRFAGDGPLASVAIDVGGAMQSNDAEAMAAAAVAGAGVVQLHEYIAAPLIADGSLRVVLASAAAPDGVPIHVLYPSARQLPPKTRAFVRAVVEYLVRCPPWSAPR